jgi:PAS domain S-box-containing protein
VSTNGFTSVAPRLDEAGVCALIERSHDAIALVDADGTFRYVSPAVTRILGFSPDELIGSSGLSLLPPEDLEAARAAFSTVVEDPATTLVYEHRYLRKDGSVCWLESTVANLLADPRVGAIVSNFRDVSDRRAAERERQERECQVELGAAVGAAFTARLPLASQLQQCVEALVAHFDAARARIWTLNDDEQVLVLQASAGLETANDEPYQRIPIGAMKMGRIAARRRPHLTNAIADDSDFSDQSWARREGIVSFAGYPLLAGERLVGAMGLFARHPLAATALTVLGSTADVIALGIDRANVDAARESLLARERAARERAEVVEARYRGLFEGVADAILVADVERRYRDVNTAATALLGYTRDELLRMRVEDIVAKSPTWTTAEYDRYQSEGQWQGELELRRKDGTTVSVEARATVVDLPEGPVHISAVRDVSERREFDRLHGELLSTISHDLKNPLTAIHGQAQLLRRRARRQALMDPEVLDAALGVILTSSAHLAAQLTELQDVALLRGGQSLTLDYQPTDLVALTQEAVETARPMVNGHRIQIAGLESELVGTWDAVRLRRVVDNLLANAIKFSPRGGAIDVTVQREDRPDGSWAILAVQDEGVGIPAGEIGTIFERFRRGSNVSGRFAGTGIGLSGARQIVAQHGGEISVQSEVDRGSTFTVALPLIPPHQEDITL